MKINEGWMKIEDQIDMSSAVGLPDVLNRTRSIPPRKIRRNTKRRAETMETRRERSRGQRTSCPSRETLRDIENSLSSSDLKDDQTIVFVMDLMDDKELETL